MVSTTPGGATSWKWRCEHGTFDKRVEELATTLIPRGTPARGPKLEVPSFAILSSSWRADVRADSAATVMKLRTCGSAASSCFEYCSVISTALHACQKTCNT